MCVTLESLYQPPSWYQSQYGSVWLCLTLRLIFPKKHACLWWLMILCALFWERQITPPALIGHNFKYLTTFLGHSNPSDGICKDTTSVVKERCVTSQWNQVGGVARVGDYWRFWKYFVVNTFDSKLFSHVIIVIHDGRSGVTTTTPLSCALGTSRGRTTNHSDVVAVTPSLPWSITWLNYISVRKITVS